MLIMVLFLMFLKRRL